MIGSVFETSVFAELVKKYQKDNIYYWRTKDKKEIDFILKDKRKVIPIEVKLNFTRFNAKPINYFNDKYELDDYRITGFDGELKNKNYIYPWVL